MIYVMGYIVAVVALLAVLLFIILEVKLAKADAPWKGLIPIGIVILIMSTVMMITMVTVGRQTMTTLKADLNNGMHGEMIVRKIDDRILGYGPIEIYDQGGVLRDTESVYLSDFDDAYPSLPRYADLFKEMTLTYEVIPSNPCDKALIADRSQLVIPDGGTNTYIKWSVIWIHMVLMLAPMAIIYWLRRKELKQERMKREMQKMSIEGL